MAATLAATAAAALPKCECGSLSSLARAAAPRCSIGGGGRVNSGGGNATHLVHIDDVKVALKGGPITIRRMSTRRRRPGVDVFEDRVRSNWSCRRRGPAAADFKRVDEEDDSKFYPEAQLKLAYHVDEGAVAYAVLRGAQPQARRRRAGYLQLVGGH